MLYRLASQAFISITPEDLGKINALQRVILGATAIDKARLMEDLPTQNISIKELVPKIQEKLGKYQELYANVIELLKQKDGSFVPDSGGDV
jgi:hypothetical protein